MRGILGLLYLTLLIWIVVNIVEHAESDGAKVLWIVLIIIFPLVGPIIWYFVGPRKR